MTARYAPLPPCYSEDLQRTIKKMLVVDASKRPSVADLLELQPVKQRLVPGSCIPNHILQYFIIHQLPNLKNASRNPSVMVINTIKVPKNLDRLSLPVCIFIKKFCLFSFYY